MYKSICIVKIRGGVTIHFEGQLISEQEFNLVMTMAKVICNGIFRHLTDRLYFT